MWKSNKSTLSSVRPTEWLGMPPDVLHPRATAACLPPQCQPGNSVPKNFPLHRPQSLTQAGSGLSGRLVEEWMITGEPVHENTLARACKHSNSLTVSIHIHTSKHDISNLVNSKAG